MIELDDRALQYGDGCFTTVAVRQGRVQWLDAHLARLQQGCERLEIAFHQWSVLAHQMQLRGAEHGDGVLKVTISRGRGGRGYAPAPDATSYFWLTCHPYPNHYLAWQQHGIKLGISKVALAKQPLLAGIKHLNRLEQVLIKLTSNDDCDDWLVCDTQGHVVETSVANVFWWRQGLWFTADLSQSGVSGVMASQIEHHLNGTGQPVQALRVTVRELQQANEIFVCNSLMGIVPVREFIGAQYAMERTRQLQGQMLS